MQRNYIDPLNSSSGYFDSREATNVDYKRGSEVFNAPRDTRSPKEKQAERNAEAKERQRKARERNALRDDNTGNRPINDNGIDEVPRRSNPYFESGTGSDIEFNGSVLICINGSPYYIDIPYDSDTGAYAAASGANFPITEP